MQRPISDHIRSNVWAIAACFIAAMGTTVLASASDEGPQSAKSASPTKQVKKLRQKLASVEQRLAALEGSQGAARPPTGPAGGELAGAYPNPTLGTVSGLDLASSTSQAGAINFGADVNLYRDDPNVLRTDDVLTTASDLIAGDMVQATNLVRSIGYLQSLASDLSPPTADCDTLQETGRLRFELDTNELWVCDLSGWLQIPAS
jgi:hypothetical protein